MTRVRALVVALLAVLVLGGCSGLPGASDEPSTSGSPSASGPSEPSSGSATASPSTPPVVHPRAAPDRPDRYQTVYSDRAGLGGRADGGPPLDAALLLEAHP